MSTKENPGRFDCYREAEPNEPIFVLLARDPIGPAAVRAWAMKAHEAGHDPDKIMEALAVAAAMDKWRLEYDARPKPVVIDAQD